MTSKRASEDFIWTGTRCGNSGALSCKLLRVAFSFGIFLLLQGNLCATNGATLPTGFTETQVANGLSSPTAMDIAPDGRLFVCLQGGNLRVRSCRLPS